MLIDPMGSPAFQLLKSALDAASMRHQVTTNNIANSSTENFQPLKVSFEEQLRNEISASGGTLTADTAKRISPQVEVDAEQSGVSIDQEMVKLSQNFIHYQALLKALTGKIEMTNLAINDGRR